MEDLGIDDKTKSTFTGITVMSTYDRYKSTNRDRGAAASAKIAAQAMQSLGAQMGARAPDAGTFAGTKKKRNKKQ